MPGGSSSNINAPEKLTADHDVSAFQCGEPSLDDWLKRRALANQDSGASKTYVVTAEGRVVGYYALATGAIVRAEATNKIRQNMPDSIPVIVLGRLAVDQTYQGKGVGYGLLRDATLRILQAADIVGIRAILLHAISEDAKKFYERAGFHESPLNPMTMMISIAEAQKILNPDKK